MKAEHVNKFEHSVYVRWSHCLAACHTLPDAINSSEAQIRNKISKS